MPRCFAIAALALLSAWSAAPAAPPVQGGGPPQPGDRVQKIKGYGETADDAQKQALEHARDWVQVYLDEHFHDLGWAPDTNELKGLDVIKIESFTQVNSPNFNGFEATARADMTDASLHRMQDRVEEARRKQLEPVVAERHALAGRILASLLAVSLVIFGYLRLEELTRGYYTTLLRLGAGAVVLAALVCLFLAF